MWTLSRSMNLLRAPLRPALLPRAQISTKPAKHNLTLAEQSIAMLTMFVTILVPSGWVLAHLEDYKKRP